MKLFAFLYCVVVSYVNVKLFSSSYCMFNRTCSTNLFMAHQIKICSISLIATITNTAIGFTLRRFGHKSARDCQPRFNCLVREWEKHASGFAHFFINNRWHRAKPRRWGFDSHRDWPISWHTPVPPFQLSATRGAVVVAIGRTCKSKKSRLKYKLLNTKFMFDNNDWIAIIQIKLSKDASTAAGRESIIRRDCERDQGGVLAFIIARKVKYKIVNLLLSPITDPYLQSISVSKGGTDTIHREYPKR